MVNWNANDHPGGVYLYSIKAEFAFYLRILKSLRFLACDDLKARQLEFNGEKINQACYYKLITSFDTVYYFQINPATDNKIISRPRIPEQIMISETISERTDLIIRRHILEPGDALPWHTDLCHRFSVIIRGEAIAIEYRDSREIKTITVYSGLAEWDAPQSKVHRAVNIGKVTYEEVIVFFIAKPGMEPQPEQANNAVDG